MVTQLMIRAGINPKHYQIFRNRMFQFWGSNIEWEFYEVKQTAQIQVPLIEQVTFQNFNVYICEMRVTAQQG